MISKEVVASLGLHGGTATASMQQAGREKKGNKTPGSCHRKDKNAKQGETGEMQKKQQRCPLFHHVAEAVSSELWDRTVPGRGDQLTREKWPKVGVLEMMGEMEWAVKVGTREPVASQEVAVWTVRWPSMAPQTRDKSEIDSRRQQLHGRPGFRSLEWGSR